MIALRRTRLLAGNVEIMRMFTDKDSRLAPVRFSSSEWMF